MLTKQININTISITNGSTMNIKTIYLHGTSQTFTFNKISEFDQFPSVNVKGTRKSQDL